MFGCLDYDLYKIRKQMIVFSDTTAILRVLFLLFLKFLHPSKVGMAADLLICQGQNEDYNKYAVPGSLLQRFLNQMYTVLTRPHSRAHKTSIWNATTLLHLKTLTEVFILAHSRSVFSNIRRTCAIKEYLQNRSRNAENKNHSEAQ